MNQKTLIILAAAAMAATTALAQEKMMALVENLQQKYPTGVYREEYRCTTGADNTTFTTFRKDFRMKSASVLPEDLQAARQTFDKEWESMNYKKDMGARRGLAESGIHGTILYDTPNRATSMEILNHHTSHANNKGFVFFDMDDHLNIVVQQKRQKKAPPKKADFSQLHSLFDELGRKDGATKTEVRYTGQNGSFIFQRNSGKGWTKGTRITIADAGGTWFERIQCEMRRLMGGGNGVNVMLYARDIVAKDEVGDELFVAHTETDGTLSFLSATVESEVCVPMQWYNIEEFNDGNILPSYLKEGMEKLKEKLKKLPEPTHGMQLEMLKTQWGRIKKILSDPSLKAEDRNAIEQEVAKLAAEMERQLKK